MTGWPSGELARVRTGEELGIAALRDDGNRGCPRTIWVVPNGAALSRPAPCRAELGRGA
jgi:hypothetical protein